jgi:hypothetical protein
MGVERIGMVRKVIGMPFKEEPAQHVAAQALIT